MIYRYKLAALLLALALVAACADDNAPNNGAADALDTQVQDSSLDTRATDGSADTDEALDTGHDGGLDTSARDTADAPDVAREDTTADTNVQPDTTPASTCGDGTLEGSEACDDGNTSDGDYCSADCSTVTGECGDGTVQSNESCDDGQLTSGCDTYHDGGDGTCVAPDTCSEGYVVDANGNCVAEEREDHVHIYVTNTCQLSTDPTEIRVPRGQSVWVDWHNHSSDYDVDVWMSYQGGYTDLAPGRTWDEPVEHCTNINRPYTEYADITISGLSLNDRNCPGHRLMIYCE